MSPTDDHRSDIELVTDEKTSKYPLDDLGAVSFDLTVDPFGNLDIALRFTDEDGQTLTVDLSPRGANSVTLRVILQMEQTPNKRGSGAVRVVIALDACPLRKPQTQTQL